jgi:hypothetical protein
MSRIARWTLACLVAACLCASASAAHAQDTLAAARELYGGAAYREALAMLDKLKTGQPSADDAFEIDKYRAFCLLALTGPSDAEPVIVQMLAARPLFRLDDSEASPRVVTAFREVRRRQLPALIEQAYARGREAYDRKQTAAAAEQFRLVLALAADADAPADRPLTKDMQTLAAGFLNLAEASKVAEPKPEPVKPAPVPPAPRPYYTAEDRDVVPPVVIKQDVPAWPANVPLVTATGMLDLLINEKGEVELATLRVQIHPIFDKMLIERARTWRYQPAIHAAQPVKYLKHLGVAVGSPGQK